MFSFMYNKSIFSINQKLSDYCKKSTNESIRKITEKYNQERKYDITNLDSIKVITNDDSSNLNHNIIFSFVCLLSSTTFIYYFYKVSR